MPPPIPIYRGQGNQRYEIARPGGPIQRGQTAPYEVNGAPAGGNADTLDGHDTPYFLARANHTGSQPSSTISDLGEAVQDLVGAMLANGANITVTYDDGTGTATIAVTGTLPAARMPAYSGDVTSPAGSTVLTLATVNANVGSFGGAGKTITATVNAKGLVTAFAETATVITASQVTDFSEAADDRIAALLAAGANISLSYNDAGNALTVALAASPALTGTPTAPTAVNATSNTQIATTAFVHALITDLINASPAALDTLKELADAIGDDPNFATTVSTSIATKLTKASNLSDLTNTATARTNLGVAIGVDVQAYHANLAALAGLSLIADRLPYANGAGAMALATFTAAGRALIDDADAAAQRATLGLVIGANVQAWDADLDALAALSGTNTIYYRSAANTWSAVTIGGLLSFSAGTLNIGSTTGTGTTVVLSAGPTLTGTTNVAALTASGLVLSTVAAGDANFQANQTTGSVAVNGTYDFTAQSYGLFFIAETNATGQMALCCTDGATVRIIYQSGAAYTTTLNNAGTVNLYYNGGTPRIQNKLASAANFRIIDLRLN